MPTVSITVAHEDNKRSRRKQSVETAWSEAGLAVTPAYRTYSDGTVDTSGWAITHAASGYAVVRYVSNKRKAIKVAKRLAPIADWNRPRAEVLSDHSLKASALEILSEEFPDRTFTTTR